MLAELYTHQEERQKEKNKTEKETSLRSNVEVETNKKKKKKKCFFNGNWSGNINREHKSAISIKDKKSLKSPFEAYQF